MKFFSVFLLLMTYFLSAIGQQNTQYLSPVGLTNAVNRKMNVLVTGQSTNTGLGNYASFDPVGGSFTFKGTVSFNKYGDSLSPNPAAYNKPASISFLSVKLEGDLVGSSYAALFNNSSLNTNAGIDLQYHFRLKKLPQFKYEGPDSLLLHAQKEAVKSQYGLAIASNVNVPDLKRRVNLLCWQNKFINDSTKIYSHLADSLLRQANALAAIVSGDSIKKMTDKAAVYADRIKTFIADSSKNKLQIDSIDIILKDTLGYAIAFQNKLILDKERKINNIENGASFAKIAFSWFTITVGGAKKDFYLFNPNNEFDKQIDPKTLSTIKLGLAYTYYYEDNLKHLTFLFNGGLQYYRDNNTERLSTLEVVQEKVIKNAVGDTTRKITKKYNVFTDPIIESELLEFYTNFYLMKSSRTGGLHVFPSWQIFDEGKGTILNLGLGYLFSFKSQKKDMPILNAEGYIQLQDVGNNASKHSTFWKRNEIGVRFTLPFNLF